MDRQRLSLPDRIAADRPWQLTGREREMLDGLVQGLKYRQIAERLYLSEGTVRNYISTLYAKLGVRDRQSAANVGREAGLLRDGTGGSAIPAASSKPGKDKKPGNPRLLAACPSIVRSARKRRGNGSYRIKGQRNGAPCSRLPACTRRGSPGEGSILRPPASGS